METILKNTENSKASEAQRFRLNLCVKIDLETPNNNIPLANRSKSLCMIKHQNILNFKYLVFHGMMSLNYLIDRIVLKIKTRYTLELQTQVTMRLPRSTEKRIGK